jgi:hypothetical protein
MSLAIYTTNFIESSNTIAELKTFLFDSSFYDDVFLCADILQGIDSSWAAIHPFYLKFFKGDILFLNLEDYVEYRDSIIGNPIIYIESPRNNLSIPVDRSMFQNCRFVAKNNDNVLEMVTQYEIR